MRAKRSREAEGEALWLRGQGLEAAGGRGYRKAAALYEQGVRLQNTSCIGALARLLDEGRGVRRDVAAARRLWARGARLGDCTGAFNMGVSFKDVQEYGKAMRWFEVAVRLGDDGALLETGKLLILGLGVRRDVARGIANLQTVIASEGTALCEREQAMLLLAYMNIDALFIGRSWRTGVRWLERASAAGSDIAAAWRREFS